MSSTAEALMRIAALYAIEADVRGCSAEERQRVRLSRSKPLVDALKPWFAAQLAAVSGKSTIAEAIRYALTRWDGLARFLDDGRIEIDSNAVERAIRPIAAVAQTAGASAGADIGGASAGASAGAGIGGGGASASGSAGASAGGASGSGSGSANADIGGGSAAASGSVGTSIGGTSASGNVGASIGGSSGSANVSAGVRGGGLSGSGNASAGFGGGTVGAGPRLVRLVSAPAGSAASARLKPVLHSAK